MDKRKLAAAYVLLVGAPLLALVGILRAGMHLSAPVAIHGNWSVQADFSPWHGVPCEALLANTPQPLLSIDQSGRDLTVTLNDFEKTVITGTIDGYSLSTDPSNERKEIEPYPRHYGACMSPQSLHLQAAMNRQGKQRLLTGTFHLEGCPSCPPVDFKATRQVPAGRSSE